MMDITTIDAISFATRCGQAAASELYGLLIAVDDEPWSVPDNWFHPSMALPGNDPESAARWQEDLASQVAELGAYVCQHQVEQGERLFRWGGSKGIVPMRDWSTLDIADRQAFEIFVVTVRHAYLGLAVAQKALEDARRDAGVKPPGLKLSDSIFEPVEPMGKLRDEAIAAAPLIERYNREQARAADQAKAEKAAQDQAEAAAAEKKRRADKAAETRARNRAQRPVPVSAGETLAGAPAPNKGGRGKKAKSSAGADVVQLFEGKKAD